MNNFKTLAEHQLTSLHDYRNETKSIVEKEWLRRYALPYPYKLNIQSQIVNAETDLPDKNAPKEVQEKAEIIRYRRELKEAGQTEIFDFI